MKDKDFSKIYRTYAEIDLEKIRHNGEIAKRIYKGKKIMCVLKADAYGHGIRGVVPAYESFADYYAVATAEEALEIRCISKKPILIFGPVPEEKMAMCARAGIDLTVGDEAYALRLSEVMKREGLSVNCHLKIDTGLNRSGIRSREDDAAMSVISEIYQRGGLNFVGTYTHFACGEGTLDWELEFTAGQFSRFTHILGAMRTAGIDTGICHCASTGGSLVHPEYCMDMVRLGMLPLGMSYSDESVAELGLRPAMRWVSFVAQIKEIDAGDSVSYGCTFRAEKPMRIAMVTCGYADGYRRSYSGKTEVLVRGKRTRVLGRIAMDYMMIDVTDLPDARVGEEVILLGNMQNETVSAQELSERCDSVSGEITCAISARVPRIYVNK